MATLDQLKAQVDEGQTAELYVKQLGLIYHVYSKDGAYVWSVRREDVRPPKNPLDYPYTVWDNLLQLNAPDRAASDEWRIL